MLVVVAVALLALLSARQWISDWYGDFQTARCAPAGWSGYGMLFVLSDQATVDKDAREMAEDCSVPNSGLPPVAPFCFS